MNIYVGNLAWETKEEDLKKAFSAYGEVTSVKIISDAFTGRSRGFGFVEMNDKTQAEAAINGMNNKEINGRALKVNEARPKTEGKRSDRSDRNRW